MEDSVLGLTDSSAVDAKDLGLKFVKCWPQHQESVFGLCSGF